MKRNTYEIEFDVVSREGVKFQKMGASREDVARAMVWAAANIIQNISVHQGKIWLYREKTLLKVWKVSL